MDINITEQVQTATIVDNSNIAVNITNTSSTVAVQTGAFLPSGGAVISSAVSITPYSTITATDLQGALEQLADEKFIQTTTPSSNIDGGDFWYNTDTETLYVYREINGVFNWVPVITGDSGADSNTLDAGSY